MGSPALRSSRGAGGRPRHLIANREPTGIASLACVDRLRGPGRRGLVSSERSLHPTPRSTPTTWTPSASVVGFAFIELLGFRLAPRLKNIGAIRLYRPDDTAGPYAHLRDVLTRPIRWELIAQQYDQTVNYATAGGG